MMTTIKNTVENVLSGNVTDVRVTRHACTVEETAYMFDVRRYILSIGAKLTDVDFFDDVIEVDYMLKNETGMYNIMVEVETNRDNEVYSLYIHKYDD